MTPNRSIPPVTVIPQLAYPDTLAAAAWLREAFGFRTRLRIGSHRVQMDVGPEGAGQGAVVLTEAGRGASPGSTLVRVEDADAHHERARRAGATIVRAPESHPYGERQYTAVDPAGHVWTFSQSIADVAPEEWGGERGEGPAP